MLHFINTQAPSSRLTTLAYDIPSPRRARQVRGLLYSLHHDRQYSVYEAFLTPGKCRGLLAEISVCCDFSEDLLALWWPREGIRLSLDGGKLRAGSPAASAPVNVEAAIHGVGNFIVCYDIRDPKALREIASRVACQAAMVQRSVYWLRAHSAQLLKLLGDCAGHLAAGDRLWAYPLRGSHELWHVGRKVHSILPMATHRWESSW